MNSRIRAAWKWWMSSAFVVSRRGWRISVERTEAIHDYEMDWTTLH
jgi:hypothetical protein